jgi:hypothetical protein
MERGQNIHYRLQFQVLQKGIVVCLGITAAVNARYNYTEVDGSALHWSKGEL